MAVMVADLNFNCCQIRERFRAYWNLFNKIYHSEFSFRFFSSSSVRQPRLSFLFIQCCARLERNSEKSPLIHNKFSPEENRFPFCMQWMGRCEGKRSRSPWVKMFKVDARVLRCVALFLASAMEAGKKKVEFPCGKSWLRRKRVGNKYSQWGLRELGQKADVFLLVFCLFSLLRRKLKRLRLVAGCCGWLFMCLYVINSCETKPMEWEAEKSDNNKKIYLEGSTLRLSTLHSPLPISLGKFKRKHSYVKISTKSTHPDLVVRDLKRREFNLSWGHNF